MYGACAGPWLAKQTKLFLAGVIVCLIPFASIAQNPLAQNPKIRMGRVVSDGAMVYRAADFDAPVLTQLRGGQVYPISSKTVGAFYKIKVKDGVYGYVSDTDVKPLMSPSEKKKRDAEKAEKKAEREKGKDEKKKRKAFEWERDRGLFVDYINYREDTMGLKPTEGMIFLGVKFSGPDTLMEGLSIDSNILISPTAPKYYEQATGHSASGMILIFDFLFQTVMPVDNNRLVFYGFGPMLKYSKINATIKVNGKSEAYDLTDVNVGAVFNVGVSQRVGSLVLRGEIQYFWEKMQYLGYGLAIQMPF